MNDVIREGLVDVRVIHHSVEAEDICRIELAPEDGELLPEFAAGAHVDVHLGGGVVRQYSLCGDTLDRSKYEICVLLDANTRGGSQAVHRELRDGVSLKISAPRNHFPLRPLATKSILIAGGIGVTPIMAMAQALCAQGEAFELHYCSRSRSRTAFLQRLSDARFARHTSLYFDDAADTPGFNADLALGAPVAGTHIYICGPSGFIGHVQAEATRLGWPDSQVHIERFSAAPQEASGSGAFNLLLARTGTTVRVAPDQTAAQALMDHGVDVMMSCEQGICGSCTTKVLEGVPDHRDSVFSPEEHALNDRFTPCCSRSLTPLLVIDL